MSRNRRRFIVALAAAVLAGIGLVGNAVAAPSCAYDGASSTVNAMLGAGDSATLAVDVSGQITFGAPAAPCGVATNTNTDKIVVSGPAGSTEHLVIDQSAGALAPGVVVEGSGISEIEVEVDLGDVSDEVVVNGSPDQEPLAVGTQGRRISTRTATSTSPSRRSRARSSSSPPMEGLTSSRHAAGSALDTSFPALSRCVAATRTTRSPAATSATCCSAAAGRTSSTARPATT